MCNSTYPYFFVSIILLKIPEQPIVYNGIFKITEE
nr:MAG TPA: hypothetical protein [Caudoviricetes sp.]